MSITVKQFNISAGQTWSESFKLYRNFGTKEVVPAEEVSSVEITFRRSLDKTSPVALSKTLSRVGDDYPHALSSAETAALNKGLFYGHLKVTFSSYGVVYAVLLQLNLSPTTT